MADPQQSNYSRPWYMHRAVTVVRVVIGVGAAVVGAVLVLVTAALGHCSAFGGRCPAMAPLTPRSSGRPLLPRRPPLRDPGLPLSSQRAPARDRNGRRTIDWIGGWGRGHCVHSRIGEQPGPGGAGTRSLPHSAASSRGARRRRKRVATAVSAAGTQVPPWSLSSCRQHRYTSPSARSSVPRRRGSARPTAKRCDGV